MKVDYSYIDTFLKVIDGTTDIKELANNVGFQTIISHAKVTGNDFDLKTIDEAVKGINNKAYGLTNVIKNVDAIKDVYRDLRFHEKEWIEEIEAYTRKLFYDIKNDSIIVYPVIGYDIGIGINNIVCVNLNSEICLRDCRELISIIIHETTHVYYEHIHGACLDYFKLETPEEMKKLLDNAIQYEGAGVFSAKDYRERNVLPKYGTTIQEDYNTSNKKSIKLFQEYKNITKSLANGDIKDKEEFLLRVFGESKLVHKLGYSIFNQIEKIEGIDGVKRAIHIDNESFIKDFLNIFFCK